MGRIAAADLTNPDLVSAVPALVNLLALLKQDINGQPHMGGKPCPTTNGGRYRSLPATLAGIEDQPTVHPQQLH